ncbi:MAG: hypothetical protein EZS28_052106 [Streblomastix strix]|uniref:Uncharacterized protein n=1 Tax=Streblomastix strix TaxID=222440 RepID=A0A5J4SKD0_9EUKA|nr:MAG: hypothetical protein EZS28_052106 [Streblomastix strix]
MGLPGTVSSWYNSSSYLLMLHVTTDACINRIGIKLSRDYHVIFESRGVQGGEAPLGRGFGGRQPPKRGSGAGAPDRGFGGRQPPKQGQRGRSPLSRQIQTSDVCILKIHNRNKSQVQ